MFCVRGSNTFGSNRGVRLWWGEGYNSNFHFPITDLQLVALMQFILIFLLKFQRNFTIRSMVCSEQKLVKEEYFVRYLVMLIMNFTLCIQTVLDTVTSYDVTYTAKTYYVIPLIEDTEEGHHLYSESWRVNW